MIFFFLGFLVSGMAFGLALHWQYKNFEYLNSIRKDIHEREMLQLRSKLMEEEMHTLCLHIELKQATEAFVRENITLALISNNKLIRAIAENIHE